MGRGRGGGMGLYSGSRWSARGWKEGNKWGCKGEVG